MYSKAACCEEIDSANPGANWTTVSNIESGAGSVDVSACPALPKTLRFARSRNSNIQANQRFQFGESNSIVGEILVVHRLQITKVPLRGQKNQKSRLVGLVIRLVGSHRLTCRR